MDDKDAQKAKLQAEVDQLVAVYFSTGKLPEFSDDLGYCFYEANCQSWCGDFYQDYPFIEAVSGGALLQLDSLIENFACSDCELLGFLDYESYDEIPDAEIGAFLKGRVEEEAFACCGSYNPSFCVLKLTTSNGEVWYLPTTGESMGQCGLHIEYAGLMGDYVDYVDRLLSGSPELSDALAMSEGELLALFKESRSAYLAKRSSSKA